MQIPAPWPSPDGNARFCAAERAKNRTGVVRHSRNEIQGAKAKKATRVGRRPSAEQSCLERESAWRKKPSGETGAGNQAVSQAGSGVPSGLLLRRVDFIVPRPGSESTRARGPAPVTGCLRPQPAFEETIGGQRDPVAPAHSRRLDHRPIQPLYALILLSRENRPPPAGVGDCCLVYGRSKLEPLAAGASGLPATPGGDFVSEKNRLGALRSGWLMAAARHAARLLVRQFAFGLDLGILIVAHSRGSFLLSRHAWRLHSVSGFRCPLRTGQRNLSTPEKIARLSPPGGCAIRGPSPAGPLGRKI